MTAYVKELRAMVLDIMDDVLEAEEIGTYIAGREECADLIATLLSTVRPNDQPPAHWAPDDKCDRHPQTAEEWDWRADNPENGPTDRSIKRLNFAIDRGDPHAPDQMALVLRVDLSRALARLTHHSAHRELLMRQKAEAVEYCSRCQCDSCDRSNQEASIKNAIEEDPDSRCWSCACGWIGCYTQAEIAEYGAPTECQKCYRERLSECSPYRALNSIAEDRRKP